MAAGLFAPQDILIYKLWLNKPYTKIHCIALGMLAARIFLEVNEVKLKGDFSFAAFKDNSILGSKSSAYIALMISIASLGFVAAYPKSANADPPSWS